VYSIGIDLGGTFTKLALVSSSGDIIAQRRVSTAAGRDARDAFSEMREVLEDLAARTGLIYPAPGGCGIGVPGVVDHRTGWVRFSGPLEWTNLPLSDLARGVLGCDVAVDIDVAAGALADLYFGCARDASDLVYISWGTGIGAGLVISRRLYHSRGGAMYELGHVPADPSSSRLCYCGCRGCLEIEAGGRAMVDQARELLLAGESSVLRNGELTPERIAEAARQGDLLARRLLERSATLMARVLAGVLALLNPDTVVFGGGVSRCWPVIREAFDRELQLRTPRFSVGTAILQSSFGDSAGVVGAALLPAEKKGL
jgi:glucokinase